MKRQVTTTPRMAKIKESFEKVLESIKGKERVSSRYIEGLVYSLLSTIQANDQNKFLTYLITFLNTFEEKEIGEFMRELYKNFPMSEDAFQKIGYLIIIGLMSIKGGE